MGGRAVDCRHFITTNPDQEAAPQRQMQYERQLTEQIRRDLSSQRRKWDSDMLGVKIAEGNQMAILFRTVVVIFTFGLFSVPNAHAQ